MASIESVRIVLMHSWSSCSSVRDGLSGALLMVSPGIGGCTIPLLASPQGEWLSSTLPTYSQHRDPQKRGPYPGEPCPLELKHLRPGADEAPRPSSAPGRRDRKSTRLNSSHLVISYAVFCLKKKKNI